MAGIREKRGLLSAGDISLFCSQLALLLQAAVSLEEGLGTIRENVRDKKAAGLLAEIENTLAQGGLLSQALGQTQAFPAAMVHMVELGEKAGRLDEVMEALACYYGREDRLKNSVSSAVLYPLLLALMMLAVVGVLVSRVLPIFQELFQSLNGADPASAAALHAGGITGRAVLLAAAVLGVLLLAALIAARTGPGARGLGSLLARFGLGRRISIKIASARFAWVMSMLLSSGFSTAEALHGIPQVLSDKQIARRAELCEKEVEQGKSLADALESAQLFSGMYSSMIRIGAKTGRMDAVMRRLAEIYEEEANTAVANAVSVAELSLVAVLSVIIGGILLSVMAPLLGVLSSVG